MNDNNAEPPVPILLPMPILDGSKTDEELARSIQASEWDRIIKADQPELPKPSLNRTPSAIRLTFKNPERFRDFPGLVVTANNKQCPSPEEFFSLDPKSPAIIDLQRSYRLEEQRLFFKYFKMVVRELPARKVAEHIAYLCESGYMDKEGILKFFDAAP